MSISHKLKVGFGGGQPLETTKTGDTEINLDVTVASTNQAQGAVFAYAKVKSLYLLATGGDLTLKTNSSSAPDQTLTLKAGVPLAWNADMPTACPLTADNTVFYLTKVVSGDTVTFTGNVLIDY